MEYFEQNHETFMYISHISIFSHNNYIINYIYLTYLNSQLMKLFNHYPQFYFQISLPLVTRVFDIDVIFL